MTLWQRYERAKWCWNLAKEINPTAEARARVLMQAIQPQQHSPEYKRHHVYAQLTKEFPWLSRKSLALTIEVVKCCG